ncbi:MAG: hypothetical protein QXZ70_05135, partial [Candidatus Bathyarchaeia archaeon]
MIKYENAMKRLGLLFIALLISALGAVSLHIYVISLSAIANNFFFGVSYGQETVEDAKFLIDKVKDYTNLFWIGSWSIATNETALNEVCDYAAKADLHFMVFFGWVSRVVYPWHQTWLETAKEKWGDKFLGAYLFDEPGGKQIDLGGWNEAMVQVFENVSDYSNAADLFVSSISSINSTIDVKKRGLPMFTSDYALYWFDYLAGYDTVFVEIGWGHNIIKHIALCRGAANVQGKDWGAIITWTYYEPPYLASGHEILEQMMTAYHAGAKYVIIFNYAEDPVTGKPISILREDHFRVMQKFWKYVHSHPHRHATEVGQVAFVLPRDYGWGMRRPDDRIWGLWNADEKAPLIWENVNKLIAKYGLKLDIIYDDSRFNYKEKYA